MKDWNLDLREGPGFIEFDMDDLEKVCQCNVDAYRDYPLYPAIFGSLAGPDIIYKNWYASVRAIEGNAIMVVDSRDMQSPVKQRASPERTARLSGTNGV